MQATRPFEFFEHVPHGAVLQIAVRLGSGQAQNDALVVGTNDPNDMTTWDNSDVLHPNVGSKQLSGQGYFARVSTFAQVASKGTVRIKIVGHSQPWTWNLDLEEEEAHLCGVFIKMKRPNEDGQG